MDSKVLRPMIMGCPSVNSLKRLRSSGMCQSSFPSLPSSRFLPIATTAQIRAAILFKGGEILFQFFEVAVKYEFHLRRFFFLPFLHDILLMPARLFRLDFVREFFENYLAKALARMQLDDLRIGVVADGQRERPLIARIDDAGQVDGKSFAIDR